MKLIAIIYSIVLFVACSNERVMDQNPSESKVNNYNDMPSVMNDVWPFYETLSKTDPYVGELLESIS